MKVSCQTLPSRDVSAACVILDIFEFQRQEKKHFHYLLRKEQQHRMVTTFLGDAVSMILNISG
jgi:hypothetical protein